MNNLDIQTIVNYIVSLTPTITAIISMIATVFIAIRKIKTNSKDVMESVHRQADSSIQMARQVSNLTKENAELKRELRAVLNKVNKVMEFDKDGKAK